MANPTTNFGWVMPTSTSLVTNLPADFNTFGQGVDTSLQYLLGGTTGQVLSKTSGTNMAFTWVTPQVGDITAVTAGTGISGGGTSGDVTVTNSMATAMTTKGDLVAATGSGTFSRLAVGSNNQTLVADSSTATGLKWATASSGSYTLISTTTLSSSATSVTFSSIPSTYTHLQLIYQVTGSDDYMKMTFNNVTTSTYYTQMTSSRGSTSTVEETLGSTSMRFGINNVLSSGVVNIPNYKNTTIKKTINSVCGDRVGTATSNVRNQSYFATNDATTAISQIDITCASNFTAGSIFSLYGVS